MAGVDDDVALVLPEHSAVDVRPPVVDPEHDKNVAVDALKKLRKALRFVFYRNLMNIVSSRAGHVHCDKKPHAFPL